MLFQTQGKSFFSKRNVWDRLNPLSFSIDGVLTRPAVLGRTGWGTPRNRLQFFDLAGVLLGPQASGEGETWRVCAPVDSPSAELSGDEIGREGEERKRADWLCVKCFLFLFFPECKTFLFRPRVCSLALGCGARRGGACTRR